MLTCFFVCIGTLCFQDNFVDLDGVEGTQLYRGVLDRAKNYTGGVRVLWRSHIAGRNQGRTREFMGWSYDQGYEGNSFQYIISLLTLRNSEWSEGVR